MLQKMSDMSLSKWKTSGGIRMQEGDNTESKFANWSLLAEQVRDILKDRLRQMGLEWPDLETEILSLSREELLQIIQKISFPPHQQMRLDAALLSAFVEAGLHEYVDQHDANLIVRSLYPVMMDFVQKLAKDNRFFPLNLHSSATGRENSQSNIFRVRIIEEPLTAQNLLTVISALTELSTKYWLIAKRRFADLIEYTQTHNGRFAEEAQIVISRVSYNSPFSMDWKVDLSAPSVAEALVTTIDGITQRRERLEKVKLENQAQAIVIKEAEQKSEQENQMALLEQEKQRLELEQRRLEVLEKQLEVQKKGIEYALEIAGKVIDTLHPGADAATRAMEIQTLLPNLIQLQNGKGLELALPTQFDRSWGILMT